MLAKQISSSSSVQPTAAQSRHMFTWTHLVSAVPESSAEPPSWTSPPHVGDASLPGLCAAPPGSFSFAHDASGAAGSWTFG